MTRARYNELFTDRQVGKTNHQLEIECTTLCRRYSIGVYYNPPDLKSKYSNSVLNKPFIGVFPNSQFADPMKKIIKNELIFLMFSESFEEAFSFILTFNCDKGEAFLKVLDMPNSNNGLVSEREINGITKAIHPDHIKFLAPVALNHIGS